LLEELLEEYQGTVFLVSHDRTFLDNVVTQVIASEGDGEWKEYIGGYSDWEAYKNSDAGKKVAASKNNSKANASPVSSMTAPAAKADKAEAKAKKLSYKEQKELEELPSKIAQMEAEQKSISEKLADVDFYKEAKPEDIKKLNVRFEELDELLLVALEKWEEIGG
jgi:ATP-binding cassette subfamily F protein uup